MLCGWWFAKLVTISVAPWRPIRASDSRFAQKRWKQYTSWGGRIQLNYHCQCEEMLQVWRFESNIILKNFQTTFESSRRWPNPPSRSLIYLSDDGGGRWQMWLCHGNARGRNDVQALLEPLRSTQYSLVTWRWQLCSEAISLRSLGALQENTGPVSCHLHQSPRLGS